MSVKKKDGKLKQPDKGTDEEAVIRHYGSWVGGIVTRECNKIPRHLRNREEFTQEANIALIKSWRKYHALGVEPDVPFTTYGYLRVRGAVIDWYRDRPAMKNKISFVSVEARKGGEENEDDSYSCYSESVFSYLQEGEMTTELSIDLAKAVESLTDREKDLLDLLYIECWTLQGIGDVVGCTESRMCQHHRAIIVKLREHMQIAA